MLVVDGELGGQGVGNGSEDLVSKRFGFCLEPGHVMSFPFHRDEMR